MKEPSNAQFEFTVYPVPDLPAEKLAQLHQLFDIAYRDANHSHLDRSLQVLGYVSIAKTHGTIAGFGVGRTLETSVPGIKGPQTVTLGGISCIAPEHRRQGLFRKLSRLAIEASGVTREGKQVLGAGRMAHPASFHTMARNPSVVPKFDVPVTQWQQEVGLRIAELYQVTIDPETFVVEGSGVPIGYPDMEIDVPDSEWRIFDRVDRDKGEVLLAMSWSPDAPEGW